MKEGVHLFNCNGVEIEVRYPGSGDVTRCITNILSGHDYPLLRNCPFRPTRVVDIGANIGAATLFFVNAYPEAQYLCYEPSPSTFSYLEQNTTSLRQVTCFNFGLSDRYSATKLFAGRSHCLQSSIVPNPEVTAEFEEVKLKKASFQLKEALAGRCILKIDTEGCEIPVLKDLGTELLESVEIIYLEYHSEADRRELDQLLEPAFALWHARASLVHRGNLAYLSQRVLAEHPHLEQWKILASD